MHLCEACARAEEPDRLPPQEFNVPALLQLVLCKCPRRLVLHPPIRVARHVAPPTLISCAQGRLGVRLRLRSLSAPFWSRFWTRSRTDEVHLRANHRHVIAGGLGTPASVSCQARLKLALKQKTTRRPHDCATRSGRWGPTMNLNAMTSRLGEWLRGTGPESDIVISSRIRLARNLAVSRFTNRASRIRRPKSKPRSATHRQARPAGAL